MALAIGQQPGFQLRFERFVTVDHPAVSPGQIVHDEASVYVVDQLVQCTRLIKITLTLIRLSSMG